LEELPDSIVNLINLREINISDNQIKQLPENICNFDKLTILNCSYNQLKQLPNSIGSLDNLQLFDCNHNQLDKEINDIITKYSKNCDAQVILKELKDACLIYNYNLYVLK
jgi:Leucine-rich repeat (LRR) protein